MYEALHEYIEVFDNEYVSFFKQCILNKLIEKQVGTSSTATQSQNDDGTLLENELTNKKILQKRVLITEAATSGREDILEFYSNNYGTNLQSLASSKSKIIEQKEGYDASDAISIQQKERDSKAVERLIKQRKLLTKSEITFIVDLLISICKYYQIGDKHALTLGGHLLPDFYNQTKN